MSEIIQNLIAKRGDRIRVTINRTQPLTILDRIAEAQEIRRSPFLDDDGLDYSGRPLITMHDIGTRFSQVDPNVRIGWTPVMGYGSSPVAGTPDYVNGYYEFDQEILGESIVFVREAQRRFIVNDPSGQSLTSIGMRPVDNTMPISFNNAGQLFLDLSFISRETQTKFRKVIQTGTPGWVKRRPVAERLSLAQELQEDVIDLDARVEYNRLLDGLRQEQRELWLPIELGVVNNYGTLRPILTPGRFDLKLDSPFYYEEFDTSRPDLYKVTAEPEFNSPEVAMPSIQGMGDRVGQRVRIMMTPQFWRVRCSYKAWYIFVSFWAFTYVAVSHTFVFLNRFPLLPRPFQIGSTDYPPIWFWIDRSAAHQKAVAQDLALQFFSPFLAFVFVFTSDGFFEIRRINSFTGYLAAAIEIDGLKRYVWRRVATNRDLTLQISAGPLSTSWINSFGTTIIGTEGVGGGVQF